jgi:ribonuclease VapC
VILDTSAIVAIVTREDDAARFETELAGAATVQLSAATLVEATMVIEGRGGERAGARLARLLDDLDAEVCPVTDRTARIAQAGWRRFGKGRHKAALNLGDCFAYALAIERDEPLLFKGEDFAATDVKRAL